MQNWSETLLSQYAASPTITALIESINDAIDPESDINAIYQNLFDISTAVGQGLDNWGQIVGVSRNLEVTQSPTYFGFQEAFTVPTETTGVQPFGQAPMYNGPLSTKVYTLSNNDYRQLILVKAAANISNLTAASVNYLLTTLFKDYGRAYVQDTGGMSQRFVFEFTPTAVQLAIITNSGVIPRSAGVLAKAIIYPAGTTFGFNEGLGAPFGSGTFFSSSGIQNVS